MTIPSLRGVSGLPYRYDTLEDLDRYLARLAARISASTDHPDITAVWRRDVDLLLEARMRLDLESA